VGTPEKSAQKPFIFCNFCSKSAHFCKFPVIFYLFFAIFYQILLAYFTQPPQANLPNPIFSSKTQYVPQKSLEIPLKFQFLSLNFHFLILHFD